MEWIVKISKNTVTLFENMNVFSTVEIRKGWTATVDKVDDYIMVKLVNTEGKPIHLCMLPAGNVSIIWENINDAYRLYEK